MKRPLRRPDAGRHSRRARLRRRSARAQPASAPRRRRRCSAAAVRSNSEMSSASFVDRAYVKVPSRRVRTSARRSPIVGISDHRSRLKSRRSRLKVWPMESSKKSEARRKSPARDGHRLECRRRQHIADLARPHPDEHRIELGRERILAAEDANLRALGGIRGRERHPAAAEQDDRGGPLGRFGDEGGTGGDFELEIRRLNGQIAQLELFRRIESELVQSADGGELLDLGDAARVSIPGRGTSSARQVVMVAWLPYSPKTSRRRPSPSGSSAARSRSLIMKRVGFGTASAANIRTPEASGVAPSAMTASTLAGSRCLLELLDEGSRRIAAARSARRPTPARAARAREGPAGP